MQLTAWVPMGGDGAFGVFFREPSDVEAETHVRSRLSAALASATVRADVLAAVHEAVTSLVAGDRTEVLVECRCGHHLVAAADGACTPVAARGAWVDRDTDSLGASATRGIGHASLRGVGDGEDAHVCLVPMGPGHSGAWLGVVRAHDEAVQRSMLVSLRAVADEAWVALQRADLVRRLQGRVDRLEALDASRTDAIAGVTHDLKSPVHVLRGFVATLRERPAGTIDHDRALAAMDHQIDRISRLLDDLMLATRAGDGPLRPGQLEPVDLGVLAGDLVATLADGDDVTLEVVPPVVVDGDRDQLGRVIVNLLDNARKYGGVGPVEVTIECVDADVRLRIGDHGPGLAEGEHEAVFGRFTVGAAGSGKGATGLGLHVARAIARGHGGDLRALPTDPERPGAVFELVLPAAVQDRHD